MLSMEGLSFLLGFEHPTHASWKHGQILKARQREQKGNNATKRKDDIFWQGWCCIAFSQASAMPIPQHSAESPLVLLKHVLF
jgi:hypothetical protein